MSRCERRRAFGLALLAAFALCPAVSQAAPAAGAPGKGAPRAPASAAQLFDAGIADLKRQKYEAACAALEESYALDANLGTLIALGDCLERWGKLQSAATRFQELISAVASASSADASAGAYRAPQLEYARSALARLAPKIPRLTLAFSTPVEPEVRVLLDGAAIPTAAEQDIGVDPGRHSIETQAAGREPWRVELELGAGEHRRAELQLGRALEPELLVASSAEAPTATMTAPAATEPPAPEPPPEVGVAPEMGVAPEVGVADRSEPAANPWRSVGWGLGGLGVAGIGVGAVAGVMVLETCPGLQCEGNRGKHLALVTDIGLGVGLAALAASVYVLVTTKPPPERADIQSWRAMGSLNARGGWLGVGHSF